MRPGPEPGLQEHFEVDDEDAGAGDEGAEAVEIVANLPVARPHEVEGEEDGESVPYAQREPHAQLTLGHERVVSGNKQTSTFGC